MFLLVPAYPGCPGQMAVKWLLLLYVCDYSAGGVTDVTSSYNYCVRSLLLTVHSDVANVTLFYIKGWCTIFLYPNIKHVHCIRVYDILKFTVRSNNNNKKH